MGTSATSSSSIIPSILCNLFGRSSKNNYSPIQEKTDYLEKRENQENPALVENGQHSRSLQSASSLSHLSKKAAVMPLKLLRIGTVGCLLLGAGLCATAAIIVAIPGAIIGVLFAVIYPTPKEELGSLLVGAAIGGATFAAIPAVVAAGLFQTAGALYGTNGIKKVWNIKGQMISQ